MDNSKNLYELGSFSYFIFIGSIIFLIGSIIGTLFKPSIIGVIVSLIGLIFFIYELSLYLKNKPIIIINNEGLFINKIKTIINWKDIRNIELIRKIINVSGPKSYVGREALIWLVINYESKKSIKLYLGRVDAYRDRNKKKIEKFKDILLMNKVKVENFDVSYEGLKNLELNLFSSPKEYENFLEENNK